LQLRIKRSELMIQELEAVACGSSINAGSKT
jgi:hypothetical protein